MALQLMFAAAAAASCLAVPALTTAAQAGDEPFLGQVMIVAQNFCPRGWAPAQGQLIAVNQNQALFALLGTHFGGDGVTTFALPDMRARAVVGSGASTSGGHYTVGQSGGAQTHTMTVSQMPGHNHRLMASDRPGVTNSPANADLAEQSGTGVNSYSSGNPQSDQAMASGIMGSTGGGQPFGVIQPSLGMTHCIATSGVFPSRN